MLGRIAILVATLLAVVMSRPGRAEEDQAYDAAALARTIAPYVDQQTIAVVHADLASLPASHAIGMLSEFLQLPPELRDRVQAELVPLNVLSDSLQPGEPADVFVVNSISDIAAVPVFFVIPLDSPAQVISQEVRRAMAAQVQGEVITEPIGAALVTGSERAVGRIKRAPPAERAEVSAAFEAAGPSTLQLLFVPSADVRRVIEVLYPKLPEKLGGGATKEITGKIEWVAVGIGFPPEQVKLRVVVQATSEEAAQPLADGANGLTRSLAAMADGAPNDKLDALARRLEPSLSESKLTLEVVADQGEMSTLGQLFTPVLETLASLTAGRGPAQGPSEK